MMDTTQMQRTTDATAEIIRHPEIKAAPNHTPLMVVSQDGTSPQRPVVVAISRVMKEVGTVEKRGENKFHGYKYATAADVAFALQRLMAENGLVVIQRERDTRYDDAMGMLAVRYDFDVMHTSGDALAPVQMTGMSRAKDSKGGFDDKATNKCHTAARKYFLLSLFQIPSGDYQDPDADETPAAPPARKSRTQTYQEQKQQPETQTADAAPPKFELVTSDGVIMTYDKLTDYLTGFRLALSQAPDKAVLWSDNAAVFEERLAAAQKAGATKAAQALEAFRTEMNEMLAP